MILSSCTPTLIAHQANNQVIERQGLYDGGKRCMHPGGCNKGAVGVSDFVWNI